MSSRKSIKIIIDTNVWVSFLIGKRLLSIKEMIVNKEVLLVFCDQLILEIQTITKRPKLKKYFPESKVEELVELLNIVGEFFPISDTIDICRDPKDNFILELAEVSQADIIFTGDKDLLELDPFRNTRIVAPTKLDMVEIAKIRKN